MAASLEPLIGASPASRHKALRAWWTGRWLPLVVVWLASAAYTGARLDRGWIPMDEGVLAHSAELVLHGALPHRDFDDAYTGGLPRFDALVFHAFGTRLIVLRIAMFAVFLLWIPAVYYIATRFAGAWTAAAITALCVVWSIPTYPAAMPSYYNLFLAMFGTAALLRFTETRHRRWLVAAGLAGGLSLVVKIVGLYYIAAAILFFAFDEHETAVAQRPTGVDAPPRRWGYTLIVTAACAAFVIGLLFLVRRIPGWARFFDFVAPGAAVAALMASVEWRAPGSERWPVRLRRLAGLVAPFTLGVLLLVAWFLQPYVTSHAIGPLVHGVFIEPGQRFQFELEPPPPLRTIPAAVAWLLLLLPPGTDSGARGRRTDAAILAAYAVILAAVIVASAHGGRPYVAVWLTLYYVSPCAVIAGCVLLARNLGRASGITPLRAEQVWIVVTMTALCSLVLLPYSLPVYIFYFAPIVVLALLAVVATRPGGPGPRAAIVALFFLVFGVAVVHPWHISLWDGEMAPRDSWPRVPLAIPRTGLRASPADVAGYGRLVTLVRAHSEPGGFIYAAPDCPELYFLAQRRDPVGTLFDFFDDPAYHDAKVLSAIDSLHVTTVAINQAPIFSPRVDATLDAALRTRFPDSAAMYGFIVRWRSASR